MWAELPDQRDLLRFKARSRPRTPVLVQDSFVLRLDWGRPDGNDSGAAAVLVYLSVSTRRLSSNDFTCSSGCAHLNIKLTKHTMTGNQFALKVNGSVFTSTPMRGVGCRQPGRNWSTDKNNAVVFKATNERPQAFRCAGASTRTIIWVFQGDTPVHQFGGTDGRWPSSRCKITSYS